MFYVYILECSDGTLYTGQTNNLERRLYQHSNGRGAKYVKSRLPFELKHTETYKTRSEAMKREYEIKKFSKQKKHGLFETHAQ